MRNGFDTLCPDSLVEFWIESDVVRAHCLACKVDDGFDGPRSTAFERTAMYELVKVDSVFSCDDVLESGACLASLMKRIGKRFGVKIYRMGANLFFWCVCDLKTYMVSCTVYQR